MKYVSKTGMLYAIPDKKWHSVCFIASEENKTVAQVIDERFDFKPLGEVTDVTGWTSDHAIQELELIRLHCRA